MVLQVRVDEAQVPFQAGSDGVAGFQAGVLDALTHASELDAVSSSSHGRVRVTLTVLPALV